VDTPAGSVPFGRYVLEARMARGGMGEVFRAIAVGPGGFEKPVVVKRILQAHAGRSDLADLFVAEAKLMSRLAHPNIVQVIDFGRGDDGAYFLVLELVRGVDLGRFCTWYAARQIDVPVPIALFVVSQALRGLHHAHTQAYADGQTLVHRDVSPGNVLLSVVGEVKVADFGVALVAEPGGARPSHVLGKPTYMPPEQFDGLAVDARTDVFAAGVVLFQVLTHDLPFPGTGASYQGAVRRGASRKLSALRPGIVPELEAIVARALARDPAQRFPDARAMAQAIEALREQGQPIATPDDLAEAVTAMLAASPAQEKRVIALGSATPVAETSNERRELTKTGADGAFTVRVSAAPEPPAPSGDTDDAPAIPVTRGWIAWVAGGAAVLAIGAFAVSRLGAATTPRPPPPNVASSVEAAATLAPPSETPEPAPATSASAAAPASKTHPPAPAAVSAKPAGAPSIPAAADCRGPVHLYASHGWVVTGGPATVQAPGRYEWPCGSFALTAVSRVDPSDTRRATANVRPGAPAVIDLR